MQEITDRLFEMGDERFREFNSRLVPTADRETIIGVKTPQVKALARELSKDGRNFAFLMELPHRYYEENVLHGAMIANVSKDIEVVLRYAGEFLPYIDNWAVCDTFVLKIFKKYPEEVYEKVKEWLKSPHTYTVRFAIVTLLQYYLGENFKEEMLYYFKAIKSGDYYVDMAVAWYYSTALVKQYDKALPLFEQKCLDTWIHNKSIQKAVESRCVSAERKAYLRSLKIK